MVVFVPSTTVTVSGSEPVVVKVSVMSAGKVVSSTSTVASPNATSFNVQSPLASVVTVTGVPFASVTTTSTPAIPSSHASCTPSPLVSSNTVPVNSAVTGA